MIELINLSLEERVKVTSQCCGFFIHTYKPTMSYPFFEILKKDLNLKSRYDTEIWCLITAINKALKAGCNGSLFSLKNKYYKRANEITNQNISLRRMMKVLELAHNNNWITFYKGYWNHNSDNIQSCFLISETTKKLLCTVYPKYPENLKEKEVVEVRDSDKNPIMKLTRFKGISAHRDLMTDYNNLLRNYEISIGNNICYVAYRQIFNQDIETAGRIYSYGGFQNCKKELRPHIMIDGEATTEVDIRGIHPSICRILQEDCDPVTESFDPYGVSSSGVFETIPRKEFRLLCKYGVMMMINCKSLRGAAVALGNMVKKDKEDLENSKHLAEEDLETLIELLVDHNKPVIFFGKGSYSWGELQRQDSKVCEGVIKRFIDKGKCVLCWHDSWVCKREDRSFLMKCIREAWYEVFNTEDNLFLKVEF